MLRRKKRPLTHNSAWFSLSIGNRGSLAWLLLLCAIQSVATLTVPLYGAEQDNVPPNPSAPHNNSGTAVGVLTSFEFLLSLLVLVLGMSVLGISAFLLLKSKVPFGPNDILKVFTITTVITGTLLAVTAGFSSEQIAPAMGLFGTIVGYLLGQSKAASTHDAGVPPNSTP